MIHAPDPRPNRVALCGRYAVETSAELDEVTCPACRAAAPAEPELLFVAPPPRVAVVGAREMCSAGRRAETESHRERDMSRYSWGSVDAAVRAWVRMRDEGASLRSTSDPSRANRVQTSKDPSLGGREHDAIERTATVGRALDLAERTCPSELLGGRRARQLYLMTVVGRAVPRQMVPGSKSDKRVCLVRISQSLGQVAEVATQEYEEPISARLVEDIRDHFAGVVGAALVDSGELRARRTGPRRGSFAAAMGD